MFSKHQIIRKLIFLVYPVIRILFRPITKRYLTIFLFHEITNNPSDFQLANRNYTTVQNFQKNIEWIAENYKVIEISQLADLTLENTRPLAVITFDDAWKGQVAASKHISSNHGLPFTLFLNIGAVTSRIDIAALRSFNQIAVPRFSEFIELTGEKDSVISEFENWQGDIMTMDEVAELGDLPYSTIANHSLHHYPAIELTRAEFLKNVEINERHLSKLNSFKKYYAFTFGRPQIDYTDEHVELLESINYHYIFSAEGKLNKLPLKKQTIFSRVNFSPTDSKKSDFWWATNKSVLLRRF